MIDSAALLAGFFFAPALLLALGHGLRKRVPRARSRFWGGVMGYGVGMVLAILAMMIPPNDWGGEGDLRSVVIHWAMAAGCLLGVSVGSLFPREASTIDG